MQEAEQFFLGQLFDIVIVEIQRDSNPEKGLVNCTKRAVICKQSFQRRGRKESRQVSKTYKIKKLNKYGYIDPLYFNCCWDLRDSVVAAPKGGKII